MVERNIDLLAVNELADIMGDDMPMLIDSYITDTRLKLAQLAELHPTTEHESIFRLAHSLKGSSRNIGVSAFADYCEKIEKQARAQKLELSSVDQQKLNQLFDKAIDAINQQLSK